MTYAPPSKIPRVWISALDPVWPPWPSLPPPADALLPLPPRLPRKPAAFTHMSGMESDIFQQSFVTHQSLLVCVMRRREKKKKKPSEPPRESKLERVNGGVGVGLGGLTKGASPGFNSCSIRTSNPPIKMPKSILWSHCIRLHHVFLLSFFFFLFNLAEAIKRNKVAFVMKSFLPASVEKFASMSRLNLTVMSL